VLDKHRRNAVPAKIHLLPLLFYPTSAKNKSPSSQTKSNDKNDQSIF